MDKKLTVYDCSIIELPKIENRAGNITPIHGKVNIPFEIKRVFYSYDIPGGEARGAHAHKKCHQFLVAASGSYEVVLDDGVNKRTMLLNRPFYGLHIPPGIWASEQGFSSGSICLVLASEKYDEHDYIRDYSLYLQYTGAFFLWRKECGLMKNSDVYDCTMIELDKHHSDRKGNISVVENSNTIPFEVKRTYYLYDVPGGESRGGHAHKELSQLIIAASGSFTVTLDDGNVKRTFLLNRPYQGLYVVPGIWRTLDDFSSGAVCLVLASHGYDESDYIRDYNDYIEYKKK